MKISGQRKLCIGILVLGLAALAADRLVLGSSASAEADNPADLLVAGGSGGARGGSAGKAAGPQGTGAGVVSVLERLRKYAESQGAEVAEMRDAFQVSPAWIGPVRRAEEPSEAAISPVEVFKRSHHLTGVMVGKSQSQAIVDGKSISIGQEVGDFRLIAVSHRLAVFESGEGHGQVVLRIVDKDGGGEAGLSR